MSRQKKAYLYAALVVLTWSTVASAFKISLRYLHFLHLLFLSSFTSLLVLFTILVLQKKIGLLKIYSVREFMRSAMLGILNPFLYYIILFKAYSLLPAQEAQPLNQTWAIVLPLLSIILLKQKLTLKSIVALFVSFTGVMIISTHGNILSFRFTNIPGALLALGSAWIWSLFWILNIKDKRDEVTKLFLNFLFGSIYIFALLLFSRNVELPCVAGTIGALYVGLFEMGITFILWLKALKLSKTTAQVSNVIYIVPFLSLIIINITVGETIQFYTIIGLIFIIAGILLQQYNTHTFRKKQCNMLLF